MQKTQMMTPGTIMNCTVKSSVQINTMLKNLTLLLKSWPIKNWKKNFVFSYQNSHKSKTKQLNNSIFYYNSFISDPTLIANTFKKFSMAIADKFANYSIPINQPNPNTADNHNSPIWIQWQNV